MPQAAAGNVISSNEQVGADVIKTGNIKDLEIVNADISATANIAKSKVPDAATKGANTDITSLGGLTTPLSVEQGGTERVSLDANELLVGAGVGAPISIPVGNSGEYLKSNGAGADPSFQAGPTQFTLTYTELAPVELTDHINSGEWRDIDLSGSIAAGADYAEIVVYNLAAGNGGVRKNGSALNRYLGKTGGFTMTVELDAGRIVEWYAYSTTNIYIYLVGYWTKN